MSGNWWLSDGRGTSFGPFWLGEIDSRFKRYLVYRRHSSATRRECWRKACEDPFARSGGSAGEEQEA